jgi:hypothetical protein
LLDVGSNPTLSPLGGENSIDMKLLKFLGSLAQYIFYAIIVYSIILAKYKIVLLEEKVEILEKITMTARKSH